MHPADLRRLRSCCVLAPKVGSRHDTHSPDGRPGDSPGAAPPVGRASHRGDPCPRRAGFHCNHGGHRRRAAADIGVLLRGVGTRLLTGTDWAPLFADPSFGVLPLLAGTLVITVIAVIVCVPLGLGSAIYLSEYASDRVRKTFKPILEVLAGIPTVVYGFFALQFVTPFLQSVLRSRWRSTTRCRPG